MSKQQLEVISKARDELSGLCNGSRKFTMRVPVNPRDSDVLIGSALRVAKEAVQQVTDLVAALERVEKLLDSLQQHTSKRAWEYITDERKRINAALAKHQEEK